MPTRTDVETARRSGYAYGAVTTFAATAIHWKLGAVWVAFNAGACIWLNRKTQ